ncbi:hypothetical protein NBRC116601_33390 [Cognatishimia sp. WU-CL00825]|uniref:O-antigen ligase family protein n=1 Tax=Cognatishimia sp. WU-CL00825 TaxID=3127658 RepID=UPI0031023BFD
MTSTALFPSSAAPADRSREGQFWAVVDVGLLFLVVIASSDMLVHLGFGQSLVWLLCYATTLLRVIMLWPYFFALMLDNKAVLAYPVVCLASVVWSLSPASSISSGVQLMMTFVIATYLGWRYSISAITRAIFLVLTLAVILSLLHWATGLFPWRVYSRAGGLMGVFSQKNMLGQRALFCVVAALAMLLMYRSEASIKLKLAALVSLALTFAALILSQSMTSVLLVPPMAGLLAVLCVRRIPSSVSTTLIFLTVMAIALGPILLTVAGLDPIQIVLDGVGKDATLTGRTVLWDVAQDVAAEHPVLGVGYTAFWSAPDFAHERLLTQHAGAVTSVSFHNFVLEIFVSAGWAGVLAMFWLIYTAGKRLLRLFMHNGSVPAACGLVFLFASILTSLLGPSLYRGHEFMIVVMVMYAVSAQQDWRSLHPQGDKPRAAEDFLAHPFSSVRARSAPHIATNSSENKHKAMKDRA